MQLASKHQKTHTANKKNEKPYYKKPQLQSNYTRF